jgi:transmembrane sensor
MPAQKEIYKKKLVERYLSGNATEGELMSFFELINSHQLHVLISKSMDQDITDIQPKNHTNHRRLSFWRYITAACLLIFIAIGAYFGSRERPSQVQSTQILQSEVAPGRNRATLTLADGQKIILIKGLSGKLAQQGSTVVQVTSGNNISYINGTSNASAVSYNTMSTGRGEQSPYPLILSDGSKVWLNAASSVTFPTSFTGKERKIVITGEAYLDVVHNKAHPFKVNVQDQTIEVLGTRFNINAYPDEPDMKTTLINGAVKLSNDAQTVTLKPGFQAIVKRTAPAVIMIQPTDSDQALAWKNGDFAFEGATLKSIMRQISRWYDVEIAYRGESIADVKFDGYISKFKNVSEVLAVLQTAKGVHFKIEGRRILVMP